jgi:hypothetical protein
VGFNAAKAVAPLEWDFTDYDAGSGTTPEPSTREIQQFERESRALAEALVRIQTAAVAKESDRIQALAPEDAKNEMLSWWGLGLDQALQRLDSEFGELYAETSVEADKLVGKFAELVARVAHGSPNADQIMALPHRVRAAFFGWFSQELLNPESVAAGIKPSLRLISGE